MTVEAFLDWVVRQEGKFELSNGRVIAMAGGTRRHSGIALNIIVALMRKLAGTGCEVHASDLAVRTGLDQIRFPDVSVFCDPEELSQDASAQRLLERPCLLFEVLSRSTAGEDRTYKLFEYRSLPSLSAIVLVEPETRRLDVYQRVSDSEWRNVTYLRGASLTLQHPEVTLTAEEIFGPDDA